MKSELAWLESLQGRGIRPGLERMRAFLRVAGHPERAVPAVIVAGTNGKGSTSATLASIVAAAGYRCGFYTSPHLLDLRERWMINGTPVSAAALRSAIRELRRLESKAKIKPTYFEATTLIAFLLFRDARCDLSVLEVGMGGRLDATNVVRPLLSLITSVSFDHMEYLGTTLRAIAREKAGVIHRGSIALTSSTDPTVIDVLRQRSTRVGAPFHLVESEVDVDDVEVRPDGLHLRVRTAAGSYTLDSRLTGHHQIDNLKLAVRAAEELKGWFSAISPGAIVRGVAAARWRGRLERFRIGRKQVWVDGAHNIGGAERVGEFIRDALPRPRTLVFGIMRDKEVEKVASVLFPLFDEVIVTEPPSPRATSVAELARLARARGMSVSEARRPVTAVARALELTPETIVVCGSLYLAGDAVRFLDRKTAAAVPAKRARQERTHAAATRPRRRPKRSSRVQRPGGR